MVSRNPLYLRLRYSTPQLQHIHQQNAEKKQQRDGPEQEPDEIGFTFLVAPGEAMVGDDAGDDEKKDVQKHIWRALA